MQTRKYREKVRKGDEQVMKKLPTLLSITNPQLRTSTRMEKLKRKYNNSQTKRNKKYYCDPQGQDIVENIDLTEETELLLALNSPRLNSSIVVDSKVPKMEADVAVFLQSISNESPRRSETETVDEKKITKLNAKEPLLEAYSHSLPDVQASQVFSSCDSSFSASQLSALSSPLSFSSFSLAHLPNSPWISPLSASFQPAPDATSSKAQHPPINTSFGSKASYSSFVKIPQPIYARRTPSDTQSIHCSVHSQLSPSSSFLHSRVSLPWEKQFSAPLYYTPCVEQSLPANYPSLEASVHSTTLPEITNDEPKSPTNRKGRSRIPRESVQYLKDWLKNHTNCPYPTEEEKTTLCRVTGMKRVQIDNWFANARRRIFVKILEGVPV